MNSQRSFLRHFRGRLLHATGIVSLAAPLAVGSACTTKVTVVEGDDGGGGEAGSGVGGTNSGGQGGFAVSSAVSSTGSGGFGGAGGSASTTGAGGSAGTTIACFQPPSALGCPTLTEAQNFWSCTEDFRYVEQWLSGPFVQNDKCCYEVFAADSCGVGRPLRVDDRVVTAQARFGAERIAPEGDLPPELREALVEAWVRDGLFEHASVAAFSRVALELMAFGAPLELVRAAHQAAGDEIRHAELCFGLAARFGGRSVSAGPLEETRTAPLAADLVELARSTFLEGCVGETLSAALARAQAERAVDPEAKAALEAIAEDESRHAELAWKTVAWAIGQGGRAVREAVASALVDAPRRTPETVPAPPELERYGRLTERAIRASHRATLLEVVIPCAHALLSEAEREEEQRVAALSP